MARIASNAKQVQDMIQDAKAALTKQEFDVEYYEGTDVSFVVKLKGKGQPSPFAVSARIDQMDTMLGVEQIIKLRVPIETKVGPYEARYYLDFIKSARSLGHRVWVGCDKETSRQLVKQFDSNHCFTSMQYLLRAQNEKLDLKVITTMRSCNIDENLLYDMRIAEILAHEFIRESGHEVDTITLAFNIGSLHYWKRG